MGSHGTIERQTNPRSPGLSRVSTARWCLVAAMVAWAVFVPGLPAQEADSLPTVAQPGPRLGVLAGMRLELVGVASPGASLDLILDSPRAPIWFSLQFLAQMFRWNVQYDSRTRRDHYYLGRARLGFGGYQGFSVYALFEKGTGIVKTEPAYMRGETYGLGGADWVPGWQPADSRRRSKLFSEDPTELPGPCTGPWAWLCNTVSCKSPEFGA